MSAGKRSKHELKRLTEEAVRAEWGLEGRVRCALGLRHQVSIEFGDGIAVCYHDGVSFAQALPDEEGPAGAFDAD